MSVMHYQRRRRIDRAASYWGQVEKLKDELAKELEILGDLPCALCGKNTEIEHWCFGCDAFICQDCDVLPLEQRPAGRMHSPTEHQKDSG